MTTAAARQKWYVGQKAKWFCSPTDTGYETFKSAITPTQKDFPQFGYVIGPFRTRRAAEWCVRYPNSMCQTVAEFEFRARQQQTWASCNGYNDI